MMKDPDGMRAYGGAMQDLSQSQPQPPASAPQNASNTSTSVKDLIDQAIDEALTTKATPEANNTGMYPNMYCVVLYYMYCIVCTVLYMILILWSPCVTLGINSEYFGPFMNFVLMDFYLELKTFLSICWNCLFYK